MAKKKAVKKRKRSLRSYFRRRKDKRIAILPTIAGLKPVIELLTGWNNAENIISYAQSGNMKEIPRAVANHLIYSYAGYDITTNRWDFTKLFETYGIIVMAGLGSKLLTRFGVNKAMQNVPLIGRYVKL